MTKILIHPENKRAYGVEYVSENDRQPKRQALASEEVVVSAGDFNPPQLFVLSGIGPEDILEKIGIKVIKDLKVGSNLQDHSGSVEAKYSLNESCIIEK